jgi:hypothetical protein
VTIIPPPQLKQALDEAARKQGTTAESLAVALLSGLLLPSAVAAAEEPSAPEGGSLADQLSYYIGSIDSGEYVPGGARLSERTGSEYGKLLLKRHRESYP